MQVVKLVVNLWGSRFALSLSQRGSSALFLAEILDRQKVAGSELKIEKMRGCFGDLFMSALTLAGVLTYN